MNIITATGSGSVRDGRRAGINALAGLLILATIHGAASAQVERPSTQPTTRDARDRVLTLEECVTRFELDPRLSLCHVWPIKESAAAGFVEQPQYKAVLERATRRDTSRVKLLPEESQTADRFGIVKPENVILRELPVDQPGDRDNVSDLLLGEPVWILDRKGSGALLIHSIDGYLGWVDEAHVQVVGGPTMVQTLNRGRTDKMNEKAEAVLDAARAYLGTPYLWGGKTKTGIDCSGLVQMSFADEGILLPRDADQQADVGKLVATRWFKDALLPGDLLFFVSRHRGNVHHVAIYVGDGKYLEAADSGVRVRSMKQGDAEYDAERAETFAWARRVIP